MLRRILAAGLLVAVVAACATPQPAPIEVASYSPVDGATGVPVNTVISATFSQDLDVDSIAGSFTLSGATVPVVGVVAYSAASRTATFTPSADLAYATTYTATVAGTVTATNGATLGGDVSWSFTTEAEPLPEPAVGGVAVDPEDVELEVGATAELEAVFSGVVGSPSQAVTWSSSEVSVATVDTDGVVTAVSVGTAVITATSVFDVTKSGDASVTVVPVPTIEGLSVEPAQADVVVGGTLELEAVFSGVVGSPNLAVTWSSSDASVATVDMDGVVTAVAEGAVVITATSVFDIDLTGAAEITVWTELGATEYAPEIGYLIGADLVSLTTDVSGGAEPYTFDLTGDLPAGVAFDDTVGTIAGTATESGTFLVTVTIGDAIGQSIELGVEITVADVLSASPLLFDTQGAGTTIEPLVIELTGGLAPFTFEVLEFEPEPSGPGPLAPGLELSEDGVISGTLTTANFYLSIVRTTDALGQIAETEIEIDVLLVLNYLGSPYGYPLGCGGNVFEGSVACPAGGEPAGTDGQWSAITPLDSIEVLGATGPIFFSMELQTDGLSSDRWLLSIETGVIFRSNDGTEVDNIAEDANSDRTYLVIVFDDGSARTAEALVSFVVED